MNIIKAGSYAAAIIAISSVVGFAYEKNAWAVDLAAIQQTKRLNMLGMENRMLTRQIMQWSTKPSTTSQERQYKRAIVDQLKSDKSDVVIKMRSIQVVR